MTKIIVDSETADLDAALHAMGLAAIATVAQFRELVCAMQEAEKEAVRSRILTSHGHGCVTGQHVRIDSEVYLVGSVLSRFELELELELERMVREPVLEPKRNKHAFGSDRPYLKKKKGRS